MPKLFVNQGMVDFAVDWIVSLKIPYIIVEKAPY